jgi:hypothetical protein
VLPQTIKTDNLYFVSNWNCRSLQKWKLRD